MDHVPDTTAEAEPEAETAASQSSSAPADPRRAATAARARELLATPLLDLVHRAATVHRQHHDLYSSPQKAMCWRYPANTFVARNLR